jgi:hypothetical protein
MIRLFLALHKLLCTLLSYGLEIFFCGFVLIPFAALHRVLYLLLHGTGYALHHARPHRTYFEHLFDVLTTNQHQRLFTAPK